MKTLLENNAVENASLYFLCLPEITYPVYRDVTIGQAKEHLEATAGELNRMLRDQRQGLCMVNKAVVTQAALRSLWSCMFRCFSR